MARLEYCKELPNGVAHLPPIIAKQDGVRITFSGKWPPRTRAEGGQVQPVLGGFTLLSFGNW